jgi:error-prone DNA polymerase
LIDQSDVLRQIGGMDEAFTVPAGRGDEARRPGGIDTRDSEQLRKAHDIFVPDLHIDNLTVKARTLR